MDLIKKNFLIFFIFLLALSHTFLKAEEEEVLIQAVADQIQVLTKDLKTLEKAVYKKSDIISSANSSAIKSRLQKGKNTEKTNIKIILFLVCMYYSYCTKDENN